jgi:hypothetical protein
MDGLDVLGQEGLGQLPGISALLGNSNAADRQGSER